MKYSLDILIIYSSLFLILINLSISLILYSLLKLIFPLQYKYIVTNKHGTKYVYPKFLSQQVFFYHHAYLPSPKSYHFIIALIISFFLRPFQLIFSYSQHVVVTAKLFSRLSVLIHISLSIFAFFLFSNVSVVVYDKEINEIINWEFTRTLHTTYIINHTKAKQ